MGEHAVKLLVEYWPVWSSLALFACASLVTPGPNNLMVTASGANFGVKRTIPHMIGIASGFAFMLCVVAIARNQVIALVPLMLPILRWISLLVLLWLAWKIATAEKIDDSRLTARHRPMRFIEAVGFQWINPKAWLMALVVTAQYFSPQFPLGMQVLIVGITFWVLTMLFVPLWAFFGVGIASFLDTSKRLRVFNVTMAILLILSVLPAFVFAV